MATERSPAPQEPTCPIACLPPEILGMIFNHVVTDMQQQYARDCNQLLDCNHEPCPDVQPYDWVDLSNVCRHWNDVVDNMLTLWGGLVLLDPYLESADARFEEVLLKARDATIQHLHVGRVAHHLEAEDPFGTVELSSLRMITQNLPRTQKFTMNINQPHFVIFEPSKYAIEGDYKNLIHIELRNLDRSIFGSTPSLFVDALSEVPLCSLQILSLSRVIARDSLKLFRRTLKELYLDQNLKYFPKPAQDQLFQPQILLDSLRDMPRLEILSLTDCMDPDTKQGTIPTVPRPVESPALKILYLEDVDYLVDKFLGCLVLPPKTKLVIKASDVANSPENRLQTLLTTVSNTLRASWRPSIESNKPMSFLELCVNDLGVQLSGSFQSDTVCQGNIDFSFSYCSFYIFSFLEYAIGGIHSLYSRSANVLSLIHPSASSVGQSMWFNILRPLQDVETLRIFVSPRGEPTYKDIPSLSSNHGNPSILFPNLSCLSFLLELDSRDFPQDQSDLYSYFSEFICELRQDLVSRREQGHQIQRLQFKFEFLIGSECPLQSPLHTLKPIEERLGREFSGVVGHVECWVEVKSRMSQGRGLDGTIFFDPGDDLKNGSCGNMCLHCRMSRG